MSDQRFKINLRRLLIWAFRALLLVVLAGQGFGGRTAKAASTFRISGNAGTPAATVYFTGGYILADVQGNYSFTVPAFWTGVVVPKMEGYTFSPESRSYPKGVIADLSGVDFQAVPDEYKLTITSPHGTATPSPDKTMYHYGDVVQFSTLPSPGYSLDYWSNSRTGARLQPGGGVVISFDDGHESVYRDVFPIMKAKGFTGIAYIIKSRVGDYPVKGDMPGYMTIPQLQELDANGWYIGNHSVTHPDLNSLSEQLQEAELFQDKIFLDSFGLTKASADVAYPHSTWNADTLTAMARTRMLTGRTAGGIFDLKTVNLYLIPSAPVYSFSNAKSMTDLAMARHEIFFYMGHDIGGLDMSLADFKTWIDYLAEHHVPVLTIDDIYARRSPPPDVVIQGDTFIIANYTQDEYTLTVSALHGTVTWSPRKNTYHYGDVVRLIAKPDASYVFDCWSEGFPRNSRSTAITIEGDTSITAFFMQYMHKPCSSLSER